MWTLSRSTRSGRGSAATGSIVVSPVLAFGLLPLRCGFEIATAESADLPVVRGASLCDAARVGFNGAMLFVSATQGCRTHMDGPGPPYENSCHVFAVGFQ
jgi:hypothetical protein